MANQGRINIGIGFNVDQSGLNQLKASLASIQNMSTKDLINIDSKGEAEKKLKEIKTMANQIETALQQSFNPVLNTYNIDAFKKKLNENVGSLSQVRAKMAEIGAQGTIAFRNLATAISSTKLPLRESHDLLKSMGVTLMNTVKWSVASNAINTVTGSVQKAWSYTKQLDESLNNIMIVTDKSADSMAQFARQANKAAKELGKSTKDYTDASLIYYQQGLDDMQVKSRTETTLKAANVTGQSTEAVSEQLTAVWNGYKVSAQESELYIDKLAAVAATTAADLEELSTGMSKVASAANTMGVDIDQLNAMLATTVSVTRQAPESVGTAFKTVFARISDIEAGVSDEATLGEYTKKMEEIGFRVLDANDKLRDMGSVIEEIGGKWTSLSREQQVALAQTMAGTRQYNNLLALFDNWSMYEQAMKTSMDAAGTLQKQQDIYMESIEAHMEQLGAAGERVYQALLDPDSANSLLDVLTEIVDKFGSFIESIGGGGNLLIGLIPVMTKLFSGTISNSLATFIVNLKNAQIQASELKSTLSILNEIDKDSGIDEYTKKIIQLRKAIVDLNRMGIISNEKYNEYNASFDELARTANEIDLKRKQLYGEIKNKNGETEIVGGTEEFYNKFIKSGFFNSNDQEWQELDFDAYKKQGEKIAEGILPDSTDNYETITRQFELMREQVSKTKNTFIDFDKNASQTMKTFLTKENANVGDTVGKLSENFRNIISDMKNMTKIPGLNALEGSIDHLENRFIELAKEVSEGKRPITDLSLSFESAGKIIENMTNRGNNALNELEKEINEIADGALPQLENGAKNAGIQIAQNLMRDELEAKINRFIQLTSNLGMVLSAFSIIGNIKNIWSTEDLSTGEKILQTAQNMITVTSMLTPSIMAVVKAYKAEKIAIAQANAERIKANKEKVKERILNEDIAKKIDNAKSKNAIDKIISKTNKTDEEKTELRKILQNISQQNANKKGLTQEQKEEFKKKWAEKFGEEVDLDDLDSETVLGNWGNKIKTNFSDFGSGFKAGIDKQKGVKFGNLKPSQMKDVASASGKAASGAQKFGSAMAAVGPWIAIIGAGILGVVAGLKIAEAVTNKEKKALEAASEAAETLNNHLNEVKQDWDNLNSSIDKLNNATNTFKDLTVGTTEWKEALIDVNSQVLELIEKYPELMQYVSRDSNGMMSISAAGLEIAKDKQLEELNKANRAAIMGQSARDKADIEFKKNEFVEADGSQTAASVGSAVSLGAGAAAGAALAWFINPILGAVVTAAGLIGSAVINGVNESNEEREKEYFESSAFDKVLNAYSQSGGAIFQSNRTLAEALGKDVSALTDMEKALIENKEETKKLCAAYQKERAVSDTRYIEIGRSILGEDAATGESLVLGAQVSQKQEEFYEELKKNAGGNQQDKAEAIEALEYLGIGADRFKGTKGINMIQYLDEQGNTLEMSMDQIYQILSQYRASEWGQKENKTLLTKLNDITSDIKNEALRDFVKTVAQENFNFAEQTLSTFKSFTDEVDDERIKAIAMEMGLDPEEVLTKVRREQRQAAENWNAPAALEGEALAAFQRIASNIDLTDATLNAYNQLAVSFDGLFAKFDADATNILYAVLDKAGDKSDELVNDLGNITWTADDARAQFVDLLNELNITMDASLIDTYVEKMRQLNGAYGYSIDAIKSMVKELREIGDIKRGDIINEEEYQKYLSKYGEDIANSLFASLGNGEYMAITESSKYKSLSEARIRQSLLSDAEVKKNRYNELIGLEESFDRDKNAINYLQNKVNNPWDNLNIKAGTEERTSGGIVPKTYESLTFTENDLARINKASFIPEEVKTFFNEAKIKNGIGEIKINTTYGEKFPEDIKKALGIVRYLDYEGIDEYQERQDTYDEELEIFNKKYGEFADKDLKAIEQAINDQFDTNLESYQTYLSTATTFDELQEYSLKEVQKQFGVDNDFGLLEDENVQKLQDEYAKQTERLAIQLFGQYEDLLGISADAIDNLLPNDPDLSIEDRINKYQEIFKMLVESTLEWESILENTERDLNKIEKVFEDVTGAAAISNLGKQIEALQQKQDLIYSYQKSWLGEEGILGDRLNASLGDLKDTAAAAGYTGFTSNVDYSTFIKDGKVDWNAYATFEQSVTTEFGKKGIEYQKVLDSVRESLEKTEEIEEQRLETIQQEKQKRLEKFELEVELELDDENFTKKLNEYQRSLDDDRVSTAKTYLSDLEQELSIVKTTKNALADLDTMLRNGQITQEGYVTAYQQKLEELQSAQLTVQEDIKAIEEARVDALNDISESYEKQVSYLEQINSLLDTSKSSMELLYGEDAYELFDAYYQGTLKNALAIQEVAEKRFANAAAKYATIDNVGMSDEEKEAIIEEYTAAGQASADAVYSVMEARRDKYLNDTEIAIKNFNKSIYGDLDMELFTEEWDWTKSQKDKYYDSVQTLFEKDKLAAQFDTAANEATSLRAQEEINKLKREEFAQLEKIEKLSEYDVQHAQKKLDILQAEIALREAQENKTQMRLMRGADGSYSYQYVADQSAITEAQEKLNEAKSALYDLDMEEYAASIDDFTTAMNELAELSKELAEDGYTEAELEYLERRKKEVENLAERSTEIRNNAFESAESAAATFGIDLATLTEGTILKTTEDINSIINTVATNGIQDSHNTLMAKITDISQKYIKEQGDSVDLLKKKFSGENGEGGLISAYEGLAKKEGVVTEAHKTEYDYLVNTLGPELDKLKGRYDGINTSLDKMRELYEKLGFIKHNVDYDTSNPSNKNSGSGDGEVGDLGDKKDTEPQFPTISQGGGDITAVPQSASIWAEYESKYGEGDWRSNIIEPKGEFTMYAINGDDSLGSPFSVSKNQLNNHGFEVGTKGIKIGNTWYIDAKAEHIPENSSAGISVGSRWLLPVSGEGKLIKASKWDSAGSYNIAFDTGGYTGEWGADGRMAMLHEKEIVLNRHDTENFLDALSILRELNLSTMAQISRFEMPLSASQNSILQQLASQPIEQNVTIQAEFPNATDKDEIKEAFNDLINLATQYVHQDDKF